jgi:hypothetical protein
VNFTLAAWAFPPVTLHRESLRGACAVVRVRLSHPGENARLSCLLRAALEMLRARTAGEVGLAFRAATAAARRRWCSNLLATSWVNPLVAHRSNFVCASQLAQKLTYLPVRAGADGQRARPGRRSRSSSPASASTRWAACQA